MPLSPSLSPPISLLIREPDSTRTRLVKVPGAPFTLGDAPHADVHLHRTHSPVRIRVVPYRGGYRAHSLAGRNPGDPMPTLDLTNGMKITTGGVRIQFFTQALEEVRGLAPQQVAIEIAGPSPTVDTTPVGRRSSVLDEFEATDDDLVVLLPEELEDGDDGEELAARPEASPEPSASPALPPPERVYRCRGVELPGAPRRSRGVAAPRRVVTRSASPSPDAPRPSTPLPVRGPKRCPSVPLLGDSAGGPPASEPHRFVVQRKNRPAGESSARREANGAARPVDPRPAAVAIPAGHPARNSDIRQATESLPRAPGSSASMSRALDMARRLAEHLRDLRDRIDRQWSRDEQGQSG